MSQSVSFVYRAEYDRDVRDRFMADFAIANGAQWTRDEGKVCVTAADGRWYILTSECSADIGREEMLDNEETPQEMLAIIDELLFLYVQYNDIVYAREFVRGVATMLGLHGREGWFDNDYGRLMSFGEVMTEMLRNPEWDWRSP